MRQYKHRLTTLALAACLAGCGGGESLVDHDPSARAGTGDGLNSSAASISDSLLANGDEALLAAARPSPAQALGIQRPPRPAPAGTSSPNLPARTPHHNLISIATLNQYCPVQTVQWTSDDGSRVCSGTTPMGVRHEYRRYVSVVNEVAGYMGRISLQCLSTADGLPYWRVETMGAFENKNCDLRPPPPPPITDPQQLAQARSCFACHRESGGTLIGPSFEQVADRYRDAPLPPGELESRIRNGSVGNWNNFPMPSNPQVSDTDLGILVPWILSR